MNPAFSERLDVAEDISNFILAIFQALMHDEARNEEPRLLLEDIKSIDEFENDEEIISKSQHIIELSNQQKETIKVTLKEKSSALGLFPFLASFGHTVELRGVFFKKKKLSEKSEEYQPNFISFVPVASVILITDDGEDFKFQLNGEILDLIIDEFLALKKDMAVIGEKAELLKSDGEMP